MADDYGEFEEVVEGAPLAQKEQEEAPSRVKMPRKGELIGVIMQRLGGNKMEVHATDGKIRNCRVPGRFKRSMWLRPRDIVMIKIWEDDESKADIIFKYNFSQASQLRKRGLLNNLKADF